MLQHVVVLSIVLQCIAACCIVLLCVAACSSMLQRAVVCALTFPHYAWADTRCRCSSGSLTTVTHCNTLQHTATHCNTNGQVRDAGTGVGHRSIELPSYCFPLHSESARSRDLR